MEARLSDNQMLIMALYSVAAGQGRVEQLQRDMLKVVLLWVPSNETIEGNERAEGPARQDSALNSSSMGAFGVKLETIKGGT